MRCLLVWMVAVLVWPGAARAQQDVPVRQIVLFTSGVGYFEHSGSVSGTETIELRFHTEQINDVLKSLLVQDLGGGRVGTVVYPSQDPLDRTLRSFAIDLTGNPSLAALLNQLRGAELWLHRGSATVQGTLVSIDPQRRIVEGAAIDGWVINLLTGGVRSLALNEVDRIELVDSVLQEELNKALAAFSQARDQDKKPVRIRLDGQGTRRVRLGYVVEAPVWKTSYRLVLPERDRGDGYLQGWAIVENQTEMDWEDVNLVLVSGRPISFVQNLYQPLYVQRPIVRPETYEGLQPRLYEGGVDLPNAEVFYDQEGSGGGLSGVVRDATTGEPLPGATVRLEGTSQGTATDESGRYRISNVAPGRYTVNASFVGYEPAQQSVQVGNGSVTINFALPPGAALDEIVVAGRAASRADDFAAAPPPSPLDPSASVGTQATGAEVGEVFQYTVPNVTLPRQRSAMIPIVTNEVEVERLSIFNPSVLATRPLRGARLLNTTDLHLAPGPVTILDAGSYAGDARLPDLPPGQERLLSFAIDLDLEVDVAGEQDEQAVRSARIMNGVLEITRKRVRRVTYTMENEGEQDRTVVVEHARLDDWLLVDTPEPMSSTPDLHRFRVIAGAGETVPFTVTEETTAEETVALLGTNVNQLQYYISAPEMPGALQRALRRAIELQEAVAGVERQIEQLEAERAEITREQERMRANMRTVGSETDYYNRLLARLEEQEDRIEEILQTLDELHAQRDERREELSRYLADLEVN